MWRKHSYDVLYHMQHYTMHHDTQNFSHKFKNYVNFFLLLFQTLEINIKQHERDDIIFMEENLLEQTMKHWK